MFDRWTIGITGLLMAFIVVLFGLHLTQTAAPVAAAQLEGAGDYRLAVSTEPAVVEANQPFALTLDIFQADGTTPVADFDEVHTKLLHLILVSEDLTQFLHLHPDYQGEGKFVLNDVVLPEVANYVLFADFTPTGDEQQVIRAVLNTEGAEALSSELTVSTNKFTVGSLTVQLEIPETLNAGEETLISFHVTDTDSGESVADLDEYLGAAGHLVILDNTANVYIHTHPAESAHDMDNMAGMTMSYGPDVQFEAAFPDTGLYAMWLQVQYQDEVYTFPFVVDVTGEASPEATAEAHGGHG